MLRASNRVLKPGGKLGFRTILSVDTPDETNRELVEMISPMADAGPGYEALLTEADFVDISVTDITPDYATTVSRWIEAWEREAEGIAKVLGQKEYEERMTRRRGMSQAIEEGLLRRQLILAVAP